MLTDERIDRAAVERLIAQNKVSAYEKIAQPIPGTGAVSGVTELVSKVYDVQAYFGGKSQLSQQVSAEGVLVDHFTVSLTWNLFPFVLPDIIPVLNESLLFVETLDDTMPVNDQALFVPEEPGVDISTFLNGNQAFKKEFSPAGRFIRIRARLDFAGPAGSAGHGARMLMHVAARLKSPFFLAMMARDTSAIRGVVSESVEAHPAFVEARRLATPVED
jgi:hypothetical protein